jgi:hypothetical protein
MQRDMAAIVTARMTAQERINFTYDQDLVKYSEVEEAKALKLAESEEAQNAIRAQFAMNRDLLLQKYGRDLTALYNSQGWQGVFGSGFAENIRQNEELSRKWAESVNRSTLMVAATMESLEEILMRAFDQWAKGMGQNIANAIVYKKSIGEAMRAATAAVLESVAAECLVLAIKAAGYGFLYLALQKYDSAAQAFTSAAIFGSAGVATAVVGRAIAPSQNQAATNSSASSAGTSTAGSSAAQSADSARGTTLQVIVNGHIVGVSGIEELTDMINDAVRNRDVKLIASQVRQSQQVTQ